MKSTTDEILRNVIEDVRGRSQQAIATQQFRGAGRGQFRQKLELSANRVAALANRQRLEEVLERLIVAVMDAREKRADVCWWNQLAVAAGVIRGGNKEAADLGRRIDYSDGVEIDIVELKAWDADDSAQEVIEQALWYGYALAYLRAQSVPPYDVLPNLRVNVAIMAPAPFFKKDNRGRDLEQLIRDSQESIENTKQRYPELVMLSMRDKLIVLDERIDAEKFARCFGNEVGHVTRVANPHERGELENWIVDAFGKAGF